MLEDSFSRVKEMWRDWREALQSTILRGKQEQRSNLNTEATISNQIVRELTLPR